MFYVLCNALLYVMFYVTHMCDALCDLGSVTNCLERMRIDANVFFHLHVVFIRLHELAWHSNASIK